MMHAEIFALRYKVYCLECGFLDPKDFEDGLESDEYDASSVHFTAYNVSDELVGSARLVLPGIGKRFPFADHCQSLFNDMFLPPPEQSAEVSRLVVSEKYRRRVDDSLLSVPHEFFTNSSHEMPRQLTEGERRSNSPQILLGLYREMYQFSVQSNIRYWYAAMERSLARVLSRLNFGFTPIGPETDYYGAVTPYLVDLRVLESGLAAKNPDLFAWFRKPV